MNSLWARLALIALMVLASFGVRAENVALGKYLCVVSHLAGIQYEKDGRTTSGNFKPSEEKFFLTLAPVAPLQECPTTAMRGLNYWYFCLAKFAAQIDNHFVLRSDASGEFVGLAGGDYLSITNDLNFLMFTGISSFTGIYVSDGKCTKL